MDDLWQAALTPEIIGHLFSFDGALPTKDRKPATRRLLLQAYDATHTIRAGPGGVFRWRRGKGLRADFIRAFGFQRFPQLRIQRLFHPVRAGNHICLFR